MNEVHVRSVALEYSEGQLFGRLVPFDVAAQVADVLPSGKLDVYEEGFRAGAFGRQVRSVEPGVLKRIAFWHTHAHSDGAGYFGPARTLEEREDGLYGEFRILPSKRDDLAALMSEGINDLSIEFKELRGGTEVDDDGVRWRTSVHLGGVALDATGAYPGAEVLSYRSMHDLIEAHASEAAAERARVENEARVAEEAAATRAAEEAALEASAEKLRRMRELDDWLSAERARQVELAARYA